MPQTEDTPPRSLRKLLLNLFNTDELRRLIDDYYEDVSKLLPTTGSAEDITASIIAALGRFGHIDGSLFEQILHERPRQFDSIRACARTWGLALTEAETKRVTPTLAPAPGAWLGKYRLLERIGQGGFGSVWACESPDRTVVAVKILRPDYGSDRRLAARFFRGAERMAGFSDPMFVKIIEPRCENHGLHYYIMEHVDGPSLEAAVREQKLIPERILPQILDLGRALGRAHASGRLHRDIKPGNIIVDRQGRLHLTDFDFVGLLGGALHTLTTTAVSHDYTAPEVVGGAPVDIRAEIYSFARVIFFLLQDNRPSAIGPDDCAASTTATLQTLRTVLTQACAREPERRYPDMEAFCDALAAALEESQARPPWPRLKIDMTMRISYRAAHTFEDRELPLRILVVGNFVPSDQSIEDRKPVQVPRDAVDRVLADANICLKVQIAAEPAFEADLRLRSLLDFHPDALVKHIPALADLEIQRNALRVLREPLGSTPAFARNLLAYTRSMAAGAGSSEGRDEFLARLLVVGRLDPASESLRNGLSQLTAHVTRRHCETSAGITMGIDEMIRELDAALSTAVDSILHDSRFVEAERAWRSLQFLAERMDFSENIYLEFFSATSDEMIEDFHDSPDISRSSFCRLLVGSTYGAFGGWPYALVCLTHRFEADRDSSEMLFNCADVGARAQTLLLAPASAYRGQMAEDHSLALRWETFRRSQEAQYLCLCQGEFLLRAPYGHTASGPRARSFQYRESCVDSPDRCPSGTSALALTVRIAESFARHRWYSEIRGSVCMDVPASEGVGMLSSQDRAAMAKLGYIVPTLDGGGQSMSFTYIHTCYSVPSEARVVATALADPSRFWNALDAMLVGCRFAQYAKVMHRESIGLWRDKSAITRELTYFLRQFVTDIPEPPLSIATRRPLRAASIVVEDASIHSFRFTLTIAPVVACGGLPFEIRVHGQL